VYRKQRTKKKQKQGQISEQITQNRKQKTKKREQKTENNEQKTENGKKRKKQRTETNYSFVMIDNLKKTQNTKYVYAINLDFVQIFLKTKL
jgi:hypothetical protein